MVTSGNSNTQILDEGLNRIVDAYKIKDGTQKILRRRTGEDGEVMFKFV